MARSAHHGERAQAIPRRQGAAQGKGSTGSEGSKGRRTTDNRGQLLHLCRPNAPAPPSASRPSPCACAGSSHLRGRFTPSLPGTLAGGGNEGPIVGRPLQFAGGRKGKQLPHNKKERKTSRSSMPRDVFPI